MMKIVTFYFDLAFTSVDFGITFAAVNFFVSRLVKKVSFEVILSAYRNFM